jgi:hypothetical protein
MTDYSTKLGSYGVGLLCLAMIIITAIHRKESIREKELEVASLRRELAEVKRDLFHQKSVGSVMDDVMKIDDWRAGNPESQDLRELLRNSDDDRVQRMVTEAETYIDNLDNSSLGALDSGVDLMIDEVMVNLRSDLSPEDLEILETMVGSEDWMKGFRSLGELSVANQMRVLDGP